MKTKISLLFLLFTLSNVAQGKLDIYFDFDKYDLNENAIKKINSWIAQGKNYQVTKLYGFCDSKGTNLYNDTLALQRVNEVYNFLKESEIEVLNEIEIRGFGEDFEQSKIQGENRRVTLIFSEKEVTKIVESPEKKLSQQIKESKKGDLIKLNNIYFFNNSATVVSKSEPTLYELLCAMQENPNLKIEIQGHICCKLPTQVDLISSARAKAVYNYLLRNKIARTRMTYKGYGVSKPIHKIPEENSLQEDENRRVEILILEN